MHPYIHTSIHTMSYIQTCVYIYIYIYIYIYVYVYVYVRCRTEIHDKIDHVYVYVSGSWWVSLVGLSWLCTNHVFRMFLRIHSVQSVINNPKNLCCSKCWTNIVKKNEMLCSSVQAQYLNILYIYPPPCLWHAWRVVLTAVLEFLSGIPSQQFRNSCWISTLRLEILPEFHLSENLTDSGKNWLKVSSFSGADIPEILKKQPLSSDSLCFDPKCH